MLQMSSLGLIHNLQMNNNVLTDLVFVNKYFSMCQGLIPDLLLNTVNHPPLLDYNMWIDTNLI